MNVKKLIRTSMIALLVVALSVSMAAADGDTGTGSLFACDSYGTEDNSFASGESVYAKSHGGLTSPPTGSTADIYVVPDDVWHDGDKINSYTLCRTGDPSDLTPGPFYLGLVSDGGGQYDIPIGYEYDIIYDCNQDGYFNASTDGINHYDTCQAFSTPIPEFATIAIPVVALLGLVLFMRRKKD